MKRKTVLKNFFITTTTTTLYTANDIRMYYKNNKEFKKFITNLLKEI